MDEMEHRKKVAPVLADELLTRLKREHADAANQAATLAAVTALAMAELMRETPNQMIEPVVDVFVNDTRRMLNEIVEKRRGPLRPAIIRPN